MFQTYPLSYFHTINSYPQRETAKLKASDPDLLDNIWDGRFQNFNSHPLHGALCFSAFLLVCLFHPFSLSQEAMGWKGHFPGLVQRLERDEKSLGASLLRRPVSSYNRPEAFLKSWCCSLIFDWPDESIFSRWNTWNGFPTSLGPPETTAHWFS